MKVFEIQSRLLMTCILLVVTVNTLFACGVCSTMMLIYIIPIFIPFFIFSLMYGIVAFSFVQTSKIIIVCIVWFVCLIFTTGFPGGPIFVIGSTLYSLISPHSSLRKSFKKKKIDDNQYKNLKIKLNKLLIGTIILATVSGVSWQIYSQKYFDAHLIQFLETRTALPTVSRAIGMLLRIKDPDKQSEYIPRLVKILEDENGSSRVQGEVYIVIASWKNADATESIANIFENIELLDYQAAAKATEVAKTLTVLDKKVAADVIPYKIEELKASEDSMGAWFESAMGVFVECVVSTGDTVAMAKVITDENMAIMIESAEYYGAGESARDALKSLGAPSYGQDSDAYRRWWEHEGKPKYEYLSKYRGENH